MNYARTAADAVQEQHALISASIEYLQSKLDEMNPETTSWKEVSRFAYVADMAREIIAKANEQ